MFAFSTILLVAKFVLVTANQHPLHFFPDNYGASTPKAAAYDAGLFTPVEDLSAVSATEFTVLAHPAFPSHSVRIKQSSFCDGTVRAYTGYLDVHTRHLFFYFFESRNDPRTDDVIMWINGGPGCSSSFGLFMALGPCLIRDASGPKFNPYSWNSKANIFFLDQPAEVGWSYDDYGESISTTEDAAKDVTIFVKLFFEHFSQFKGRPFHLAGESYAGRYLPIFATEIYDQNARAIAAGLTPINLTSLMIGNGLTDYPHMITSYYDMQCTGASVEPFQNVSTCVRMQKIIPRCQAETQKACIDVFDAISCEAAMTFCIKELMEPFSAIGKNPNDISKDCEGIYEETVCYPFTQHITDYLNKPETRQILNVDPSVGNFTGCNMGMFSAFNKNLDEYHQTQFYVTALLERGVKILVYVGTYDLICNWVGNERWTLAMDWSGKDEFTSQKLREWKVNGELAGLTRSANGLTFATVQGAGHIVPYDKPVQAFELVNRWLDGAPL